jgi:regulator of sirC expression with transglutaminase-like and TPR domain
LKENEIRAMASLLGDRSVKVRNRVSLSLEKNISITRPVLVDILSHENDPLVRERIDLLLKLSAADDPAEHWQIMADNMCFNVRDGMVAISMLDVDEKVSRIELLQAITDLSDNWIDNLSKNLSEEEKVHDLMSYLFNPDNFVGNSEDYYSLDNCFLHRILRNKKGLPVTLCILAVMLAEEANLPLLGIGLPLHFIAGHFQGSKGISFYDCFDGGREVSPEECVNYLHSRGIFFHPQLLSPCDNESILQRVLVNIKHIAQRKGLQSHVDSIERISEIT